jgi:hypothetical protein
VKEFVLLRILGIIVHEDVGLVKSDRQVADALCPSETCQVEGSAEREELYEILKRRLCDTDPAQIKKPGRGAQTY